MYPWKNIAVDIGYRYVLNLNDLNDRHGFVVKIGTGYWPEKAMPPVNRRAYRDDARTASS